MQPLSPRKNIVRAQGPADDAVAAAAASLVVVLVKM